MTEPDQPKAVSPLEVSKRLQAEGRWPEVEPLRNQMMREARKTGGMSKEQAQAWVYAELDKMYPPPPVAEPVADIAQCDTASGAGVNDPAIIGDAAAASGSHSLTREGRLQGLDQIPETWPQLPGNATLAAELSWVQAERLRIVEEKPSGAVVVHLDRAGSPAPSWAALSWLETSIRSYAKFVDICAKGLAGQELESDMVRRERRSIEDVRRLLAEMLPPSS